MWTKISALLDEAGKEVFVIIMVLLGLYVFAQENRKIIMVVDTGLPFNIKSDYLCNIPQIDLTNTNIYDYNGHGSNVIGLITKGFNYNKYCILSVKWYHNNATQSEPTIVYNRVAKYSDVIKRYKPYLVNLSLSGVFYSSDEKSSLQYVLNKGTIVVVAAGNDGHDLSLQCRVYPACYGFKSRGFFVVSDIKGLKGRSNFNGPVNAWSHGFNQCVDSICLTGTSQATANYTNFLISR